MYKVFFAIYDDAARHVPHKFVFKNPYAMYRSTSMSFVEELSEQGYEPLAVLLEDDIQHLKEDSYTNDGVDAQDIAFLKENLKRWEWSEES